jgi:hypothetical protein
MSFVIPVHFAYNGRSYAKQMGPFSHSAEREFALTVNRRAIDECTSVDQLRPVAKNLLEGWCCLHTALKEMMLENIQLRQALDKRNLDLEAAEEIVTEASMLLDTMREEIERGQQSGRARKGLWPWQK